MSAASLASLWRSVDYRGRGDLPVKYQFTAGHREGSGVVLVATAGRYVNLDSTGR